MNPKHFLCVRDFAKGLTWFNIFQWSSQVYEVRLLLSHLKDEEIDLTKVNDFDKSQLSINNHVYIMTQW